VTSDLDAVLASIDGALADDDLPDAMRWTPNPETVNDAGDPYTEDSAPLLLRPLTMPEAVAWSFRAEQSREDYAQALADLRAVFEPAAEAVAGLVETFGKIAADAGLRFSELVEAIGKAARDPWQPIPPPRRLRTEDPRGYALALRQARSTGPDRQVQHRPRPRRHT
jgi:hypothetical protein